MKKLNSVKKLCMLMYSCTVSLVLYIVTNYLIWKRVRARVKGCNKLTINEKILLNQKYS